MRQPFFNLTTLDGLLAAVAATSQTGEPEVNGRPFGDWRGTVCYACGEARRMSLELLYKPPRAPGQFPEPTWYQLPWLFRAKCFECRSFFDLLLRTTHHDGQLDWQLIAVHSDTVGGAGPNTPAGVRYYLDQAVRSASMSAFSAAVGMYRAALDHLMVDQGYSGGMLGERLRQLRQSPNPPAWLTAMGHEYLDVLAKLGNGALHTNDGQVEQQTALDAALVQQVRLVFAKLLDVVYEAPARDAEALEALRAAAAEVGRRPKPPTTP